MGENLTIDQIMRHPLINRCSIANRLNSQESGWESVQRGPKRFRGGALDY